ncbi:hypothetical protein [uncultured Bacteroides sp.]|nr:hypothetical protein [uncultured Bacteroides sp.]
MTTIQAKGLINVLHIYFAPISTHPAKEEGKAGASRQKLYDC